jgi:class 3 adenylate cyclase
LCFGLGLRAALRPAVGIPFLGVRAAPDGGYPTALDIGPWSPFVAVGLESGDALVQIGDIDLRGMGPVAFYAHFLAEGRGGEQLPVVFERAGVRREGTIEPPPAGWSQLPVSFAFAITALLVSLRAPPSAVVRTVSRVFGLWAITQVSLLTGGEALNYVGLVTFGVAGALANPLGVRALQVFARGAAPTGGWARFGPWLWAVIGPLGVSYLTAWPLRGPLAQVLFLLATVAYPITLLVLVARGYRDADAVRRRQIRWAAFGFYAALAPAATLVILQMLDYYLFGEYRRLAPLAAANPWLLALIPISVGFAIFRYNLFDIDRLWSAAASYNVVLVVLVGFGLAVVPRFGELGAELLGVDPRLSQLALSLALAAVVVPAHQRLRPRIDRLFFKERYALGNGIADLLGELSICADARALTTRVGERVDALLRPESCVVYARAGDAFTPVFVAGRAIPPAFEAESALAATLLRHRRPLALSALGRRPDQTELGPFDRAALEALSAEVVVPLRQAGALVAFLCLGPKRSGDVYTTTDLSHLAAVAEAVSSQLLRFDQEQTLRQAREMQDSLRRYVPGAVAEELASGSELGSGERQVSVLFVDIRGYTSFAESRAPEDIFSTVNRYTERVSEIVRRHGGAVVEFNGDGMMAVFGAPRELPAKERAAVAAGREIVGAVEALPVADPHGGALKLSVGVGIATGPAFVGNIRAADRMIWSAIGNTTNLAARLQGLTRELGAALVIDAVTWQALPEAGDFRRHPARAIRGRREAEDVYALSQAQ